MLKTLKENKNNNKGFTIIEVMIVLAIAGLIILIVLLAVPALQRSGRNTAMKNDASAISAGINEFKSNNDGRSPNVAGIDVANLPELTISRSGLAGAAPSSVKVQGSTVVSPVAAPPAAYAQATEQTIYIVVGHKCTPTSNGNYGAAGDLQANVRSTAVLYPVEQRTAVPLGRCIDS